jgi:geranylgeranyl diphosphate synthase, type II
MNTSVVKTEIDQWLDEYFKGKGTYNKKIFEAMSYSLQIGGKRIRPLLLILTYSLYKKNYKEILPVACAMEMIHTYSLIHDDLPCMDNDDLRRGKPTNHKVFGEAMAVLAGDGLLNEAVSIMFNFCLNRGQKEIRACGMISEAAGAEGMIGGQVVDMLSVGKVISQEELAYMHRKKTGELIKAAVLSGAILGEACEEDVQILAMYGEKLGIAFQIKDDILDVIGNTELLGKKVNSDENNSKTTFVTVYGLESCKEKCSTLTDECLNLLKSLRKGSDTLEELTLFLLKREF